MLPAASSESDRGRIFFAPEHAQVIMDAPFAEELGLRGILEGIVSLCGFKLFEKQRRKPKARKAT
jgi:hypothetical protein